MMCSVDGLIFTWHLLHGTKVGRCDFNVLNHRTSLNVIIKMVEYVSTTSL